MGILCNKELCEVKSWLLAMNQFHIYDQIGKGRHSVSLWAFSACGMKDGYLYTTCGLFRAHPFYSYRLFTRAGRRSLYSTTPLRA